MTPEWEDTRKEIRSECVRQSGSTLGSGVWGTWNRSLSGGNEDVENSYNLIQVTENVTELKLAFVHVYEMLEEKLE